MRKHTSSKSKIIGLFSLLLLLGLPSEAFAGRLSGSRSSSRGSSSSHSSSSSSHSSSGGHSRSYYGGGYHPGYGFGSGAYGYGYEWGPASWYWWLMAPWTWPHALLSDDWDRTTAFPDAPYQDSIDGYVRIAGLTPSAPGAPSEGGRQALGNGSALRLWGEGGAADSNFYRAGGGFLWSGYHRMELGGDLRHYWEHLPEGGTDRQWIGSLWTSILFAQSPRVQFRTGLGARWMPLSNTETALGAFFMYGADFYPVRPLILSIQGDVGVLGEASASTLRGTLGMIIGSVEVYGGYETFRIDNNNLDTWVGGVRLWQ